MFSDLRPAAGRIPPLRGEGFHAPDRASVRPLPSLRALAYLLLALAWGVLTFLASPSGASGQDAVPILERASERYAAMDGFCADFRQELEVALLRQRTVSEGELCQRPPGRFDMTFTNPEGDRIVADGTHIWIYFPSTDPGQAIRIRRAGAEERFDFHAEFLSDPGERYRSTFEGTDEVDGRTTHRILLEPRQPSPYVMIRVWIDDREHLLRKLEIHEEGETTRILELTNLRLNPTLRADRFTFEPPEGVQVIRREGLPTGPRQGSR